MDKTIIQQIDEMFARAAESFVRRHLKTARELAELEALRQAAADKQRELTSAYEDEYVARVETARQQLYDEAAQKNFDHPAPPGVSKNTGDEITRRAHEIVQLAHEGDLAATRIETQGAFEQLLEQAYRREQMQGRAVEQFLGASDRRSGPDRRTRNQTME